MTKLAPAFLVVSGAVLAAATFYDASVPTQALGLPTEGGEAIVALVALSLSAAAVLFGVLGFRKRPQDDTLRSAS